MMIIGLTGRNASGKGEVAKVLQEGGFYYLSLSDLLRKELADRRLEVTRENLIRVGREMRNRYGGGFLADRALQQIDVDKNYIVDSIRNPREVEVLGYLAQGLQNKEIALQLGITERTVKFHVSSILSKLDAGNRTEAVANAAQRGLIDL